MAIMDLMTSNKSQIRVNTHRCVPQDFTLASMWDSHNLFFIFERLWTIMWDMVILHANNHLYRFCVFHAKAFQNTQHLSLSVP